MSFLLLPLTSIPHYRGPVSDSHMHVPKTLFRVPQFENQPNPVLDPEARCKAQRLARHASAQTRFAGLYFSSLSGQEAADRQRVAGPERLCYKRFGADHPVSDSWHPMPANLSTQMSTGWKQGRVALLGRHACPCTGSR